jgi:branched-chain amino acid transport system permease protein
MSSAGLWTLRLACLAVLVVLPIVVGPFWLNMITLALIYSLVVYSINVLTGFSGLLSFGQAGFVGAAAYTYGVLSITGVPFVLCVLAGLALATFLGLLLGLPAARLKGHYLAIGTLGFGVLGAQAFNNMVEITRGPMGLLGIRSLSLDRIEWYFVLLVISLGLMAVLNVVERRTFLGVMLKSVKYDEVAAEACGMATFGVKLLAFCTSALLAGLCGVLLAAYMRFLTPDLFVPAESFRYLMMAVVGGAGSATGGLIASLLLTAVPELLRSLGETNFRLLVYGTMVLFVLWFVPGGIGGLFDQLIGRRTRNIPVPPANAETAPVAAPAVAQ